MSWSIVLAGWLSSSPAVAACSYTDVDLGVLAGGTTSAALSGSDRLAPSCGVGAEDAVVTFVAPEDGTYTFQVASSFAPTLALFDASTCAGDVERACVSGTDTLVASLAAGETLAPVVEGGTPGESFVLDASWMSTPRSCPVADGWLPLGAVTRVTAPLGDDVAPSCGVAGQGDLALELVAPTTGRYRIEATVGSATYATFGEDCASETSCAQVVAGSASSALEVELLAGASTTVVIEGAATTEVSVDSSATIGTDIGSALGSGIAEGNSCGTNTYSRPGCLNGMPADDTVLVWTAPADGIYRFTNLGSAFPAGLAVFAYDDYDVVRSCSSWDTQLERASSGGLPMTQGDRVAVVVDSMNRGGTTCGDFMLHAVDVSQCTDSDWDGSCDFEDLCQGNDAAGDTDFDGVCDQQDLCFGTDVFGDADADGFCDDPVCLGGTDLGGALGSVVASGDSCASGSWLGPASCGEGQLSPPDLYRWRAPADGTYTFSTVGSGYDVALTIRALPSCLDELACDDDAVGSAAVISGFAATGGTEYMLAVSGKGIATCGAYALHVTDEASCPDADADGVCDPVDQCTGYDPVGDADADGVCDDRDVCQGDDATGDGDGDGVCGDLDLCLGDDATGDSNGNGVCDDLDTPACFPDFVETFATGYGTGALVVDTCGAGDELATTCSTGSEEIVFLWDSAINNTYRFSTTGSRIPATVSVRPATDCTSELSCDTSASGAAAVEQPVVSGGQYLVVLEGASPGVCGEITLNIFLPISCSDVDFDAICDVNDLCFGYDPAGDSNGDGFCDDQDPCWFGGGDSDGDGVCNDVDLCTGDDATGDADADCLCNDVDLCTGDDASGDTDADGVCDDRDMCLGDDRSGDSDGDGLCDDRDFAFDASPPTPGQPMVFTAERAAPNATVFFLVSASVDPASPLVPPGGDDGVHAAAGPHRPRSGAGRRQRLRHAPARGAGASRRLRRARPGRLVRRW
jgi:hypothetical protein